MMKKLLLASALMLLQTAANSQLICATEHPGMADLKVYVTEYQGMADLLVYKQPYQVAVGPNNGQWFFTPYQGSATKIIYFTDQQGLADLIICYVDTQGAAGWKNREKKRLLE